MDEDTADDVAAQDASRPAEPAGETQLSELALLFLRLGTTAFGGPAAHIAMMHDEVVRRRAWLTEERFLDLLGAINLIPGPNSTELAIHIGWARRRWAGLAVAGLAFILPAMLLTGIAAWAYVHFGSLPSVAWLLYGVKPVILGVILQAVCSLAPKAARTTRLRVLLLVAAILTAVGVNELAVLFGVGAFAMAAASTQRTAKAAGFGPLGKFALIPVAAGAASAGAASLSGIFWVFLKIGSVLFGSGYVLVAFLRADLVQRLGWITEAQLIDAVAAGQVTPGPVFTTATFVGYLLAGPYGALVATAGIFLPAFVFVAASGPLVPRLRASPSAGAFLDGVNVASLALMTVVTIQLGQAALIDLTSSALAIVSAVLLLRFRWNASWLVLGGAVAGWTVHACGIAGA